MYLALYRKYRPKTFDDVISQPHIVTTLRNQISTGQNAHAYLFTGSRGTGKTTCAKILAMALNCKNPVNGNPCLECESCREIENGSATDVVEMDAASNNKVEDVHILQEQIAYTPVSCKYRIYIVDEVHMLSAAAFNALLKTLEEPPPHVIFILATTELHKVPATIQSRCQRFEFRRIDISDSSDRLMSVAENEGFSLTRGAAEMISRISDGGMRDALSLLDRCIAVGREVTEDVVRDCAGVADDRYILELAELAAARDIPGCIRLLEQLYKAGKDISRIMEELGGVYRDLMLCRSVPGERELLSAMPDEYPEIERIAEMYTLDDIMRCLTLVQECVDGISRTRQRRALAEMCFVKLCTGAPTAAQSAEQRAAQPVTLPARPTKPVAVDFKPMGSEFTPLPDEKLSPKQAAAVKKIQAVFNPPEEKPAEKTVSVKTEAAVPPAEVVPLAEDAPPAEPSSQSEVISQKEPEKAVNADKENTLKETPPAADINSSVPAQVNSADVQAENAAAVPEDIPLPELNSKPAAIEDIGAPPPPDEPPEEFVPQREFDTSDRPAAAVEEKKPDIKAVPPAEPEKPDKSAAVYESLTQVTDEQWRDVISRVNPMYGSMLDDSTASVSPDGVLEIRTANTLLQNQVQAGYQGLEDELEKAFGKKVRAKVIAEEEKNTAEDNSHAVKELLSKAERLNIEVQYK